MCKFGLSVYIYIYIYIHTHTWNAEYFKDSFGRGVMYLVGTHYAI